MQQSQPIEEELKKITALLRDSSFALEMAKNQEAAYYTSQGQPSPLFLSENEEIGTIEKSVKEEKIATNIAGFYALECGVGLLMEQKGGTPLQWLNKIKTGQLDSTEQLVMNRFANATWKAGQPFRSLERISRDVFISAVFLPDDEVKKDAVQVSEAAVKLTEAMAGLDDTSATAQLERISQLLKDMTFAMEMARYMEAAYYVGRNETPPPFLKPGEDTATMTRSFKDDKIATNIAGFYALECGLSYLATAQHQLPSEVLKAIVNDRISTADKNIFERFANATWKAGQPFRGLDRITRETFTSFDLLPQVEIDKDWVQIKAAAEKLSKSL